MKTSHLPSLLVSLLLSLIAVGVFSNSAVSANPVVVAGQSQAVPRHLQHEKFPRLSGQERNQRFHEKLIKSHRAKQSNEDIFQNVQSLIQRVLTRGNDRSIAQSFVPHLEIIDYETVSNQLRDVFEIDVCEKTSNLVFRGSSANALTAAFGHYLRYYLQVDVHWENAGGYSFDAFTTTFPAIGSFPKPSQKERIVFLSSLRYYQNTCTASYSHVWKNWTEWEMEIDWMALNGINLPLAFTGQEIVWQKLWKQYGVSDNGLQQYFTGPAFLTWQRMANIRGYAGPLSDSWINQQADLQRSILTRYSELGMIPVLPAFNGVVPQEMQSLFPEANITRLSPAWNNFPDEYSCNYIVASTDPLFQEIGQKFLQLQVEIFGEIAKSHIYNCDTFNENKPASTDFDYLSGSSYAVYSSMKAADPEAIWLMQGWMFVNDPFWTDDTIASYFAGVPDDGMIVLDLTAEDVPVWNKISTNGKSFIWCMLHNYGGTRGIYGNLTHLANNPIEVQAQVPDYFLGTGLTMEAIDHNPVVYELMVEMAKYQSPPNVNEWVAQYTTRRYGLAASTIAPSTKAMAEIGWKNLVANSYQGDSPSCHYWCIRAAIFTQRPQWSMFQSIDIPSGPLAEVWAQLHRVALANSTSYTYDLVDVGRQVMSNLFRDYYFVAQAAYERKDAINFAAVATKTLDILRDMDSLLSTHENYLLGKWIAAARSWAKDDEEAKLFDYNARNQITLWGANGEIDGYAAKHWAGLVKGYYSKRWELFFQTYFNALQSNTVVDEEALKTAEIGIGQTFSSDYSNVFPTQPTGSSLEISEKLQSKYGIHYQAPHGYTVLKDTDVSGYNLVSSPMWTKNLRQLERLCDSDAMCVAFTSEGYLKTDTSTRVQRPGVNLYFRNKCVADASGKGC